MHERMRRQMNDLRCVLFGMKNRLRRALVESKPSGSRDAAKRRREA